ncbi:NAD(P)/FAD-dependent oxidoreductase [Acuticoccus sp. I52.16.1]|uniref:NAD(P)/FAD-dependent oxidoreductase n=1 Tax=Acuticoccus sp. I52.16.1 TaxID=2928472 RepID=UPI001FD33BCD|nr:FAD-dependent oxidoreductase [Acuticoccus sp. I52.16.1]UOM32916.1 NAD(P)/FAD-dependent oxidoreductase [Acuticoccus sp. I52.16.1]
MSEPPPRPAPPTPHAPPLAETAAPPAQAAVGAGAVRGCATPTHDLAIIGGGPAGLGAALEARRLGLRVVVLEREAEAGGIPRHCGHPPFGLREFGLPLTGPAYARRLVAATRAAGAEIRTHTAVVAIEPGPRLVLATPHGVDAVDARRVLIATGVRETTRAGRLIGGTKPGGVMNTATLQGLVYLNRQRPFVRPIIVGTELVAFSAILTLRHAGIRPLAMVEPTAHVTARWPSALLPRLLGIPLWRGTELVAIEGTERVTGVTLRSASGTRHVATDGVVLTGGFRPEATLVRQSHLTLDPATGGPEIDQFGRTCDPAIFAAGNMLHPVETAGWCHREGRAIAARIAESLAGALPPPEPALRLRPADGVLYAVPQRIVPDARTTGAIQLRAAAPVRGRVVVRTSASVRGPAVDTVPERRILMPLATIPPDAAGEAEIAIEPDGRHR